MTTNKSRLYTYIQNLSLVSSKRIWELKVLQLIAHLLGWMPQSKEQPGVIIVLVFALKRKMPQKPHNPISNKGYWFGLK